MKPGPEPERDLRIIVVIMIVTVLGAVGCLRRPLPSFDLAVPPQVLVVGARAGVVDSRARFREVCCAIREDHGKHLRRAFTSTRSAPSVRRVRLWPT